MVSHSDHFHIIHAAAEQGGEGAVGLGGAAGGHVVSRLDLGIETLPAQSLVPTQEGNACLAGVCVLHVCRGTGGWEREEYSHLNYNPKILNSLVAVVCMEIFHYFIEDN